jgi:hypothetical protein
VSRNLRLIEIGVIRLRRLYIKILSGGTLKTRRRILVKNLKKFLGIVVIGTVIAVSAFAQEKTAKNTVMFGSMLSYERVLTPKLGIGADGALDFLGFPTVYYDGEKSEYDYTAFLPYSFDVFARLYPWAGKFFVHLGLGIQGTTITDLWDTFKAFGFHAKLQVGWRLDIGQPDRWVFEVRLGPGMSMGGLSDEEGEKLDDFSYFMPSFPIQLGLGYAF